MAISLGQAALAFAGGAARGYNEDVAARRKQAMDLERMVKERNLRLADTMYVQRYKENRQSEEYNNKIEALGGSESFLARHSYLTKELGIESSKAAQLIQSGAYPKVPMKEIRDNPYTDPEAVINNAGNTRKDVHRTRVAGTIKRVDSKFDGPNLETEQVPVQDIQVTSDEEIAKILTGSKAKILKTEFNKDTGQSVNVIDNGDGTYSNVLVQAPQGFQAKTTESEPDTQLTKLLAERTSIETLIEETEAQGGDSTNLRRDLAAVNQGIDKATTITGRTEQDVLDKSTKRALTKEIRISGDVIQAADQLAKFSSAELSGAGAIPSNIANFFADQIESITGKRPGTDGSIDHTNVAFHMANDFEGGTRAQTFLEKRMAKSAENAYETILKYKAAKMLKPEGKLNVDDIERMDSIFGTGISGGPGYAKAASVLRDLAITRSEKRIAELIQGRREEGFTGTVRYNPKDSTFYYKIQDTEGKISYLPYVLGE